MAEQRHGGFTDPDDPDFLGLDQRNAHGLAIECPGQERLLPSNRPCHRPGW
jgi:hypothetical protein